MATTSLACFTLTLALLGADEFPYHATITQPNVTARSGPTFGAYPTEKLPQGSQVEVHQAVAGGWVAIRPPEEAFDWVPSHAIDRTSNPQVGKVKEEFPAFIGSNVKRVEKHLSQVSLKSGEMVEIMAEKHIGSEQAEETWYKIKPPAGEFRWVQTKYLTRQSPEEWAAANAEKKAAREREIAAQLPERPLLDKIETARRQPDQTLTTDDIAARVQERVAKRFPPARETPRPKLERSSPNEAVVTSEPRPSRVSLDPSGMIASPGVNTEAPKERWISPEDYRRNLQALDVDLTLMVSQDVSQWRIRELKQRAEDLVDMGPTPLERGQARLLLDKIAQFEATLPPGFEEPPSLPTKLPTTPAATPFTPPAQVAEANYDGRGYLMPVLSSSPGTPKYQLVDRDGNTLQFVTPAPGVNLDRYVRKQVGVIGQRGYVESLQRQHVTATRVVELDKKLR